MSHRIRPTTGYQGAARRLATLVASTALLAAGVVVPPARGASTDKLNVLFIAIDDLRPQLGCYGHAEMSTPALDRLASQGRIFTRHYVQVPTCGASRCAMLTGRYPREPKACDNAAFETLPREPGAAPASLPQLFKQHGYRTASIGKITHNPDGRLADGAIELPFAWDEATCPVGKWGDAWAAFFAYADGSTRVPGRTAAFERADVADDGYPDGLIADEAIEKLRQWKDEPFFLAVGFFKPHLPFNAPARYWDVYDPDALPAPPRESPSEGVDPAVTLHKSGELTTRYANFAAPGKVSTRQARQLRHAYSACVSYADAQVGRVLAELDSLGIADNTIVVVWGDHGWHLGEHGVWGKHTLHEVALRSPLIVRAPGIGAPGTPADGIVESIDIYPTLAERCGLPATAGLDGRSFAALLRDACAAGKTAARSFWAGGRGHSLRTDRYRITEYARRRGSTETPHIELYDHREDPEETTNLAAKRPDIVLELTSSAAWNAGPRIVAAQAAAQ